MGLLADLMAETGSALLAIPAIPAIRGEGRCSESQNRKNRSARDEARQAKVEAALSARPELRVAFDVNDVPLRNSERSVNPAHCNNSEETVAGALAESVSVVLAVRHGNTILSGELHIPRERWDMRAFLAVVDCGSERTQ
jgi:hypothetical protein